MEKGIWLLLIVVAVVVLLLVVCNKSQKEGLRGRAGSGGIRPVSRSAGGGPRSSAVPLSGIRRAAGRRGGRGGARHHRRGRRRHRRHRRGGYYPYWHYYSGYPYYYWWYDPLYYYDVPYYLDFDDPCDDKALQEYKNCIDSGTDKKECATKLEGALDICYA